MTDKFVFVSLDDILIFYPDAFTKSVWIWGDIQLKTLTRITFIKLQHPQADRTIYGKVLS